MRGSGSEGKSSPAGGAARFLGPTAADSAPERSEPRTVATDLAAPGMEFHRGVGALLADGNRVLLVHRGPTRAWAPSSWDVPGGHVEAGELEPDALIRELREELAIAVDPAHASITARLRGPNFEMTYFLVRSWRGEPRSAATEEHDALAWVTEGQHDGLVLADPAALDIIRRGFLRGRRPDVNTPVPLDRPADQTAIAAVAAAEMIDGLSSCRGKVPPGAPPSECSRWDRW